MDRSQAPEHHLTGASKPFQRLTLTKTNKQTNRQTTANSYGEPISTIGGGNSSLSFPLNCTKSVQQTAYTPKAQTPALLTIWSLYTRSGENARPPL